MTLKHDRFKCVSIFIVCYIFIDTGCSKILCILVKWGFGVELSGILEIAYGSFNIENMLYIFLVLV